MAVRERECVCVYAMQIAGLRRGLKSCSSHYCLEFQPLNFLVLFPFFTLVLLSDLQNSIVPCSLEMVTN